MLHLQGSSAIICITLSSEITFQYRIGPDRPIPYMDPIDPPCTPPPPQERMRPILLCSWDLSEHEKWMPPSPNWDGLPVGHHFQNGRHRN